MVGGKVIGLARNPENTLVNVRDQDYREECSIRVIERRLDNGEPIKILVGDVLWWQGNDAMWTPKEMLGTTIGQGCGKDWDIHIPRVGYSH